MMRLGAVAMTVGVVLLASTGAEAQTTAAGRAFGTIVELLGQQINDQSDTGVVSAPSASNTPDNDAFDKTAAGATIPATPLLEVVTGPSRTRGCADASGCPTLFPGTGGLDPSLVDKQFALSEASNATASVLIDAVPPGDNVVDVVSNGSFAQVACNASGGVTATANSEVDLLVIAGNVVPIPGPVDPNTTIVSGDLPLIVLNEQFCPDPSAPAGTTRCIVNAAHIQVADPLIPGVLDIKVSGSQAALTNASCPGGGNNCNPNLTNSQKVSQVLQSDRTTPKAQQVPQVGDPIRFTVSAVNSSTLNPGCPAGAQTGHNLRVIDRIPKGIDVDITSITLQTDNGTPTPITGTIANCPDVDFTGCSGEAARDTSRQCLTVVDGDLAPGQTKRIAFIGVVNSSATGGNNVGCDQSGTGNGICNTALIQVDEVQNPSGTPRTSAIQCPIPGGVSGGDTDFLKTTGSGGCSLRGTGSRGSSETLPMLALGIWLIVRRWRKRNASPV